MGGWVPLYRDIDRHWVWQDGLMAHRWMDLLILATWERKKVYFGGEMITLKRGQIATTIRTLMARWHTNAKMVLKVLKTFEDDLMISCESDPKKTLITIRNFDKYQIAISQQNEDLFSGTDDVNNLDNSEPKRKRAGKQTKKENKKNNSKNLVVEDARAKESFEEFTSRWKVETGCMTLGVTKEEYEELVTKIISEWQFTNAEDWSFQHFLNHARLKLRVRKEEKAKENGQHPGRNPQTDRGNESENPLSRAKVYVSKPDED